MKQERAEQVKALQHFWDVVLNQDGRKIPEEWKEKQLQVDVQNVGYAALLFFSDPAHYQVACYKVFLSNGEVSLLWTNVGEVKPVKL